MNTPAASTFQLLYVSDLNPGTSDGAVAAMAALSRERNLRNGISGALLFDGSRFCQLLEGPEPYVRLLMKHISADSRHRNVSLAAQSHFGLRRLLTRWRLACCTREVLDPLTATPFVRDEVAIALFMSALAAARVV